VINLASSSLSPTATLALSITRKLSATVARTGEAKSVPINPAIPSNPSASPYLISLSLCFFFCNSFNFINYIKTAYLSRSQNSAIRFIDEFHNNLGIVIKIPIPHSPSFTM
jgi:hypothetical protein